MQKKFLLAIGCVAALGAGAQIASKTSPSASPGGETGQMAQVRNDILALSPEAEAIGKYGLLPVSLHTGIPNISIPLHEIKTPNLSLSFSLNYHYNGYRPTEAASWAGLGWSVQG
ncbi:MAG: hypothetical protein EOP09_08200, partial [Proteobacteria bacterium]